MVRHATFPIGGLHAPTAKRATRSVSIRNAILPPVSIVTMRQSSGRDARRCVEPGDLVGEGTIIGRGSGEISANVHSPVPGRVQAVRSVLQSDGVMSDAVVIALEGSFERLGKAIPRHEWRSLRAGTIVRLIEDAGIVGMTGESQPTHTLLGARATSACRDLIVSGVESEPYLSADHRLMLEFPDEVIEGLQLVEHLLKPQRVVVGVAADKPDALRALSGASAAAGGNRAFSRLAVKYPQGDARQLIRATIGIEVPTGRTPLDAGCVTIAVSTLFAVWEAVVLRKPLIERVVTVGGGGVNRPANIKVRIGTPIGSLLEECGGLANVERIVLGGPFRGYATDDLSTSVTKTTTGILALTRSEVRDAPRTNCISCGRCSAACPMGLDPTRLFKLASHGRLDDAVREGLLDCSECGGCGYVCPAHIPLVDGLRDAKRFVRDGYHG